MKINRISFNPLIEKIERHHHIIMLIILMMMLLAPLAYSNAQPCVTGISETHNNVSCQGLSDGSISISTSVSQGSLSFIWNDGNTCQNRTNLPSGLYMVTAYDGEYCNDSLAITINEPAQLIVTESHIASVCNSDNNSIAVTPSGGTSPYSFLWNDGNTDQDRNNLNSGTYTVTVTDIAGCTKSLSITFNYSSFQAKIIKPTLISCSYSCDGSLKANVPAGSPYNFLWSTGATTKIITNLCAGYYTVTVTNSLGCSRVLSTHICGPKKITATTTKTEISLAGAQDGSVSWQTTGGTAPYTYLWNDGHTSGNRNNIAPGKYTITVSDLKSCKKVVKMEWKDPLPRMGNISLNDELEIIPNPTSDNFEIEFNVNSFSQYTIDVLDDKGCRVLCQKYDLAEGIQQLEFDFSQYAKGIYTLIISNPERRFVKKLVKL